MTVFKVEECKIETSLGEHFKSPLYHSSLIFVHSFDLLSENCPYLFSDLLDILHGCSESSDSPQPYGAHSLLPNSPLSLPSCWCEWFHITLCPDFSKPLSSYVYPAIHSADPCGEHLLPCKLSNFAFLLKKPPKTAFPEAYSFLSM